MYKEYLKYMGVSGILITLLGIGMLITSMILVDPYDVKLRYRIGFLCLVFGSMILMMVAFSFSLYETKYKKLHLLNHYSLEKVKLNKPYKIVCGVIGVGKTTFIESMKIYDPHMQYIEVINELELPVHVRLNAVEIIHIERMRYHDQNH